MRVEVTERIFTGRCEIQTEWCRARACGALGSVLTPEGREINVCGACLSHMAETGTWTIPGTRRQPRTIPRVREEGQTYTPNVDAIKVEPGWAVNRGRCEMQAEVCEAREGGLISIVMMPNCREIWLCGACLEKMAVSGAWDLGWSGGAAVAEIKRLTKFEAAVPAA
jgi:hypothetical protein